MNAIFVFPSPLWKILVLNLDLSESTSVLRFDCFSIDSLCVFAKQGGIAMDTFHGPITSLAYPGTFFQSYRI